MADEKKDIKDKPKVERPTSPQPQGNKEGDVPPNTTVSGQPKW